MLGGISTQVVPAGRQAGVWAATALGVTVVGVVVVIVAVVVGRDVASADRISGHVWEMVLTIVSYGVAGAILIDRRPDLPFGWLLAVGAAAPTVAIALRSPSILALVHGDTSALPRWGLATGGLVFLPTAIQGLVNVRFPSGRVATTWGRVLEIAIVACTALGVLGGLFGSTALVDDGSSIDRRLGNPLTGETAVGEIADGLAALVPLAVLLGLVAGVGVVVRWRRAAGLERQQLKWRAVGVIVAVALFPLAVTEHLGFLNPVDPVLFVLTLAIPVLRYRLWSIDTIIRRSVVYGGLSVVLVVVFAAITALGAALVSSRVGVAVGVVVVAVAFAPLRDRAQRIIDHLMYGQRSDPYRALAAFGRQLDAAGSPRDLPDAIVRTVATSLRLPYVAIERTADATTLAEHGRATATVERWPLTFEGRVEAHLAASPRRGDESFDGRDRQLLDDLARQAGVAIHAAALTDDLLAARQRLVTTREEERRRLRRDLHDGLGPLLTGIGLNLDAARGRITVDATAADQHLTDAKDATVQAMSELRRLVYGLRPPALDDLGLTAAIRAQAERLGAGADLEVSVDADPLPQLPAAVEVAAFRTAVEAVNNSVRHGKAHRCAVTLRTPQLDVLIVEVHDDGTSSNGAWQPGVGLTAMRERIEELGGDLHAGPTAAGGAKVTARFPLVEVGP